jgi:outer membrane beta-barrel protein
MTLRAASLAILIAAAAAAAASPSPASAQSKADAFAGKIPTVSGQLYRKAGRLEATLTGNLSLNDAFYTKYFGGLKLTYHFDEHWSAGLGAAGGMASKSGSAVVCDATTGCTGADDWKLHQVPGRIRYIVGAEAAWSPIYGKLNVLSEQVAHFDLSVFAGPDLIARDDILDEAGAKALGAGDPPAVNSIGGHFGLGARLFLREWVAIRLEVKDYVYAVKVPNNGPRNDIQNQLFAELGASFFLPTRNRAIR